jgi:hypothetical protein
VTIRKNPPDKGQRIRPTDDKIPPPKLDYPVFCFRHIQKDYSISHCEQNEKISLLERLHTLSLMTWQQIRQAHRHGLGSEKIAQSALRVGIPVSITPDVTFYALRFDGMKPMVGYITEGFIFHIVYLDRGFKVYRH